MLRTAALEGLGFQNLLKTKKHTVRVTRQADLPIKFWLSLGLVAINLALLISYVIGVNSYAAKGLEIKQLQTHMDQLTQTNQQLSLKVAQASSMLSIQNDFTNGDFVAVGAQKFLKSGQAGQLTQR